MRYKHRLPFDYELEPIKLKLLENNKYSKRLILTIDEVIEMYSLGLEVKISNKNIESSLQGMYFPDKLKSIIYKNNIPNEHIYDITILHETIHAKEELLDNKPNFISEWHTELSAQINYIENNGILEFIKELYNIKKF